MDGLHNQKKLKMWSAASFCVKLSSDFFVRLSAAVRLS